MGLRQIFYLVALRLDFAGIVFGGSGKTAHLFRLK